MIRRCALRLALLAVLGGCSRAAPNGPGDAGHVADAGTNGGAASMLLRIERGEDRRSVRELAFDRGTLGAAERRRLARAYARIADDASAAALLGLLSDEDDEVVAWAAYGLGFVCKGHEDAHVRALVARAVTWSADARDGGAALGVAPPFAIARALGKCATPLAERTLAQWVKARGAFAEPAAYALGDVVTRRGSLSDETMTTLLDAATPAGAVGPLRAALQPFSRMTAVPETFRARLVETARALLDTRGVERVFAVRALAKSGVADAPLAAVVGNRDGFTIAERVEAARGLATAGPRGRRAAAEALVALAPGKDALATADQHVVHALIDALGASSEGAQKTLYALAALPIPASDAAPALARRAEDLRCHAASVLARGDFDAEVLTACAPAASEASERARLRAVLAGPLSAARRGAAFAKLARSPHLRVREAALEAGGAHAELGPELRPLVGEALASKKPGLVATAADLIAAHPTRFAGAEGSGRALAPELDAPFAQALAEAWAPDLVETRASLLDAAVAVGHPKARELAQAACHDVNVTLRARGAKALGALGDTQTKCEPREGEAAPEIDALLARPVRLDVELAGGAPPVPAPLAIVLDPVLAPVTTTRIAALARAGFYRGIVIHRVVPGFVVQLGDPGGDGYGGSGKLLRCETSPVPFAPLDVGMALAGRDTGSSQFFVTLSRTPHLDGDYARIGHAQGDWDRIVEGDTIAEVRVKEE